MRLPTDEGFRTVQEVYDQKVFEFLRDHQKEILDQLATEDYFPSGSTEIPTIPLVDEFISGLEGEIGERLTKVGHDQQVARQLVEHYQIIFYRSSLPNMIYHDVQKKIREQKSKTIEQVDRKYSKIVLDYILAHAKELTREADNDLEYLEHKRDVPVVPKFDSFIADLEVEIQKELAEQGISDNAGKHLTKRYRDEFYRSGLRNLGD